MTFITMASLAGVSCCFWLFELRVVMSAHAAGAGKNAQPARSPHALLPLLLTTTPSSTSYSDNEISSSKRVAAWCAASEIHTAGGGGLRRTMVWLLFVCEKVAN
jgi:hypothetical protein